MRLARPKLSLGARVYSWCVTTWVQPCVDSRSAKRFLQLTCSSRKIFLQSLMRSHLASCFKIASCPHSQKTTKEPRLCCLHWFEEEERRFGTLRMVLQCDGSPKSKRKPSREKTISGYAQTCRTLKAGHRRQPEVMQGFFL